MKALALRGVCIGPERHLAAGEVVDIDAQLFLYLSGIGAVKAAPELLQEEPQPVALEKPARKEK